MAKMKQDRRNETSVVFSLFKLSFIKIALKITLEFTQNEILLLN